MILFYLVLYFIIWCAVGCLVVMVSERFVQWISTKNYTTIDEGHELCYIIGVVVWPFWILVIMISIMIAVYEENGTKIRIKVRDFFRILRKK